MGAYSKAVECKTSLLEQLRAAVAVQQTGLLFFLLSLELEQRRLSVKEGFEVRPFRFLRFQKRRHRPHCVKRKGVREIESSLTELVWAMRHRRRRWPLTASTFPRAKTVVPGCVHMSAVERVAL